MVELREAPSEGLDVTTDVSGALDDGCSTGRCCAWEAAIELGLNHD